MLQGNVWTLSQSQVGAEKPGAHDSLRRAAAARFQSARFRARIKQFALSLVGRTTSLLHLDSVLGQARRHGAHHAGVHSVPIRAIRGSEGRCDDFDADFRPLKTHNKARWIDLAAAWQRGVVLPPVELIRVGDVYFVRDGHHRISVAQAFDQEHIDAEVTVWDVRAPSPISPS